MKVFLDDHREPPKGWTKTWSAQRTIQLLKTGMVDEMSLDHDLGDEKLVGCGYDVLLWLEGAVYKGMRPIPKIHVHSMNPVGKIRMLKVVERIESEQFTKDVARREIAPLILQR